MNTETEFIRNPLIGQGSDEGIFFADTCNGGRVVVGFNPDRDAYDGQVIFSDGRDRFVSEGVYRPATFPMDTNESSLNNLAQIAEAIVKDSMDA